MRVAFKIAWRYFFSKSRQTIINRINAIALIVIVVATASLLVVLSAFSGLKDFGLSFSNAFDPDHRVTPVLGKTLTLDSIALNQRHSISEKNDFAQSLQEKVILSFKEKKNGKR
jgi:lipoprotein-releasing system permease protein